MLGKYLPKFQPMFASALRPTGSLRFYAGAMTFSKPEIEDRVITVLKGFSKVDKTKLSLAADFHKDLGLDSLDTVEVVMAFEDEFEIEIPDKVADEIRSGNQAVDYIYQAAGDHH